jgi:hypothetical protein
MLTALLSVFGNIMVTEIYRLGTPNESWSSVGIFIGCFLAIIFLFFGLLWKMYKNR